MYNPYDGNYNCSLWKLLSLNNDSRVYLEYCAARTHTILVLFVYLVEVQLLLSLVKKNMTPLRGVAISLKKKPHGFGGTDFERNLPCGNFPKLL